MAAEALNLELVVKRPSGARIVQDYVAGRPDALPFFEGHFRDPAAYGEKALEIGRRFDRAARLRAAEAIGVPPGGDARRLERFVDEGGYVVTTGQQPALFGGPLYSVYKGLSTVRLAQALEARLGKPVLPLFWIGSEDHDWEESNHTCIVGVDNELHRPELATPASNVHAALHRIPLGPEVEALREAFLAQLPSTDYSRPYVDLLREAAAPGATLPGSFRAILEELLGPRGLFFTDAADPAVKNASAPILFEELDRSAELESVLFATGARLQRAGYDLQVSVLEGGANLFLEGSSGRERIYREDGGFRLHLSGERLSAAEIKARAVNEPSVLSPNVLLRPVVESAVFPTLSYVAGPGEMAYFAQLRDYFRALGIRMPVVHPRYAVTAVEGKVRKVLDKFGLDVDALTRPFHEITGEIARDEIPEEMRRALGGLREAVERGVGDVQRAVKLIDPTLDGPVQRVRSQSVDAIDELERKVVQALKRKNEVALAQLEKARLHLFPLGKPQERVLSPFYYLARYGPTFLDALLDRFEMDLGKGGPR